MDIRFQHVSLIRAISYVLNCIHWGSVVKILYCCNGNDKSKLKEISDEKKPNIQYLVVVEKKC